MPSRDELEQEVAILEAENEQAKRELHQLRAELAAAKGTATALALRAKNAGVELEESPEDVERSELDETRKAIETDLQALDELHNPPPPSIDQDKAMTSLDVVRHNNEQRAIMDRSLSAAGQLISRIAAIVRIDDWSATRDPEGRAIINAVQRFEHLSFYVSKKRKDAERDMKLLPKHATAERAELQGWLRALDWIDEKLALPTATATASIPLTAPDGMRLAQGDGTDSIVRQQGEGYLQISICRGDLVERRVTISDNQLSAEGYGFSSFIKEPDENERQAPYR